MKNNVAFHLRVSAVHSSYIDQNNQIPFLGLKLVMYWMPDPSEPIVSDVPLAPHPQQPHENDSHEDDRLAASFDGLLLMKRHPR